MANSRSILGIGRSLVLIVIGLAFSLFLISPAQAETPTKLYGVVTDSEGAAIPGVGISVVGPDGFSAYVSTDEQGLWEVPILSKGGFSATINVDDLPEGQALTDPQKSTVKANVFMLGVDPGSREVGSPSP